MPIQAITVPGVSPVYFLKLPLCDRQTGRQRDSLKESEIQIGTSLCTLVSGKTSTTTSVPAYMPLAYNPYLFLLNGGLFLFFTMGMVALRPRTRPRL